MDTGVYSDVCLTGGKLVRMGEIRGEVMNGM